MNLEDILRLLLRLEWQGDEHHFICPSCRASQMHGHMEDCALAKQIAVLHIASEKPR